MYECEITAGDHSQESPWASSVDQNSKQKEIQISQDKNVVLYMLGHRQRWLLVISTDHVGFTVKKNAWSPQQNEKARTCLCLLPHPSPEPCREFCDVVSGESPAELLMCGRQTPGKVLTQLCGHPREYMSENGQRLKYYDSICGFKIFLTSGRFFLLQTQSYFRLFFTYSLFYWFCWSYFLFSLHCHSYCQCYFLTGTAFCVV